MTTKSYTSQLIDRLNEEHKDIEHIITTIKSFSKEVSLQRKNSLDKQKLTKKGIMSFGKYKGQAFEDILAIDKKYIQWLNKNNQYLTKESKELVTKLLEDDE